MTVKAPARPDQASRELEALMAEARRRARRRRVGYAAGVAAVLLGIAVVLLLGGGEDADHAVDENPRSAGATGQSDLLFVRAVVDSHAGTVFDEGVFAIDSSTGKVRRLRTAFNCGDTPFCLISTGGELVISSVGRTTAYDPAARGRRRAARLGNGWITVPSTSDGRVWLGILARGKLGGPQRRGLRAVREVDLEGRVIRSMRPPRGQWPVAAVESGLLFERAGELGLWSFPERRFTLRIPGVYAAAVSGSVVVSCGDRCRKYVLTDTRTGAVGEIAPPVGYRWVGSTGAFSADGSHIALSVAPVGEEPRPPRTLAVVDVRTLDAQVIPGSTEVDPTYGAITWSTRGDRLFFVGDDGTVRSYRVGSETLTAHASFDSDDPILQMVAVRPRD